MDANHKLYPLLAAAVTADPQGEKIRVVLKPSSGEYEMLRREEKLERIGGQYLSVAGTSARMMMAAVI